MQNLQLITCADYRWRLFRSIKNGNLLLMKLNIVWVIVICYVKVIGYQHSGVNSALYFLFNINYQ